MSTITPPTSPASRHIDACQECKGHLQKANYNWQEEAVRVIALERLNLFFNDPSSGVPGAKNSKESLASRFRSQRRRSFSAPDLVKGGPHTRPEPASQSDGNLPAGGGSQVELGSSPPPVHLDRRKSLTQEELASFAKVAAHVMEELSRARHSPIHEHD